MKKFMRFALISLVLMVFLLNLFKREIIINLPFNIPGKQMAATIPPLGIFIEKTHANNKDLINHEHIHWLQYQKMGLFGFYRQYLTEYFKVGRFDGSMEIEARKLSKIKKYQIR